MSEIIEINTHRNTGMSELIRGIAEKSAAAASKLAKAPPGSKDEALLKMSIGLIEKADHIISENTKDVEEAVSKRPQHSLIDRRTITPETNK